MPASIREGGLIGELKKTLMERRGVIEPVDDVEEKEYIEVLPDRMSCSVRMKKMDDLETLLAKFYAVYQPGKVGLNELVVYAEKHGVEKLNSKLKGKYGADLGDFMRQRSSVSKRKSKGKSIRKLMTPPPMPTRKNSTIKMEKLGHLLRLFYVKYDSTKERNEIEVICNWAKSHGIQKLNKKLLERYPEDLDSFARFVSQLTDDLAQFYLIHDPHSKPGDIDTVFTWAIIHGVDALNLYLAQKYKDTI